MRCLSLPGPIPAAFRRPLFCLFFFSLFSFSLFSFSLLFFSPLLCPAAQAQEDALSVSKAAAVTRTAPDTVTALAVSYGECLAAGLQNGRLAVWTGLAADSPADTSASAPRVITAHTKRINAVCFSADAALIATASDDGQVAVWNAETLARVDHFAQSGGPKALTLDFSSDNAALAAGYDNGTVKVWSVHNPQPAQTFAAHKNKVLAVAFAQGDDNTLFSVGEDKMLDTWNVATGEQVTQVNLKIGHENDDNFRDLRYRSAAVAGTAKRIAVAASVAHIVGNYAGSVDEHYVKIINTATGAKTDVVADTLKHVAQNSSSVLAFSDDGILLATVGQTDQDSASVSILQARTKASVGELTLPSKVQALEFGWRQNGWEIVVADGKNITSFPIKVSSDSGEIPTDALAVTVPTDPKANSDTLSLAHAAADTMQNAAVGTGHFVVISRSNLNEVMDELALSRTGMIEKKTRLKLGHLVNARRFLVARIAPIADSYHVTLWLEAVETGKVLASKEGDASSRAEVLTLAKSITVTLLRGVPVQ